MRPRLLPTALALLATSLAAGCGTFANMQGRDGPGVDGCSMGPPKPFGGVSRDVRWTNEGYGVFLADVPLSFVGDLVTLPVILVESSQAKHPSTQKEKDEAARKAALAQGVQDAQDRKPGAGP